MLAVLPGRLVFVTRVDMRPLLRGLSRAKVESLARGKKWDGPLGFPHDRYSIVWTTAKG